MTWFGAGRELGARLGNDGGAWGVFAQCDWCDGDGATRPRDGHGDTKVVICAVFVRVGARGGYYHGSSWRSRRAQRKRPRHPSSLHDLDLFPARRFHEGPTPTRSTHTTLPQDPQDSKDSRPQESTPNMIPLIPTLALAFVSFICSAFVILRILIPILPPHPLSRRVRPVSSQSQPIVPSDQLTALTLTVRIWSS